MQEDVCSLCANTTPFCIKNWTSVDLLSEGVLEPSPPQTLSDGCTLEWLHVLVKHRCTFLGEFMRAHDGLTYDNVYIVCSL